MKFLLSVLLIAVSCHSISASYGDYDINFAVELNINGDISLDVIIDKISELQKRIDVNADFAKQETWNNFQIAGKAVAEAFYYFMSQIPEAEVRKNVILYGARSAIVDILAYLRRFGNWCNEQNSIATQVASAIHLPFFKPDKAAKLNLRTCVIQWKDSLRRLLDITKRISKFVKAISFKLPKEMQPLPHKESGEASHEESSKEAGKESSSEEHFSEKHSSEKHSKEKHSRENHSREKHSKENHSKENHSRENHSRENHSSEKSSTAAPSTVAPSTAAPSTAAPSTAAPSTAAPSTAAPSTAAPSTAAPSTVATSTEAASERSSESSAEASSEGSSEVSTEPSTQATSHRTTTICYSA